MKKYKYLLPLLAIAVAPAVTSCEDPMDVDAPVLEVSVKDEAHKAGQPVTFLLRGASDIISFYSGEQGHRYEYKDAGETCDVAGLQVSFSSQFSNAASGTCVRKMLVSTNFNGNYKSPYDLMAASWTDITDGFILASDNTLTASGTVDITRYREEGKPLYFAFVYKHSAFASQAGAPSWRSRDFKMTAVTGGGDRLLANISDTYYSAGFNITDFAAGTDMEGIGLVSSDYIRLQGKNGPVSAGNEIWATSRALEPFVLTLPVETSIPVKAQSDERPAEFAYTFEKAGEYSVVFVGKNASGEASSEVVYRLEISITD